MSSCASGFGRAAGAGCAAGSAANADIALLAAARINSLLNIVDLLENSLRTHLERNLSWQALQSLPTAATAALNSSPALLLFSATSASVFVCVAKSATIWSNSLRLLQIAGSARVLPSFEMSGYASPTKVAICASRVACLPALSGLNSALPCATCDSGPKLPATIL